jgi:hypothetical protein
MTNPMGRFHDITTGEVIDRELTDAEVKQLTEFEISISPSEQSTPMVAVDE